MVILQNLKCFNVEMILVIISVSRTLIPDFIVYCWSIQLNFLTRDEWNLNFLWHWKWHLSRIIIGKMDSLIVYHLEECLWNVHCCYTGLPSSNTHQWTLQLHSLFCLAVKLVLMCCSGAAAAASTVELAFIVIRNERENFLLITSLKFN